MKLKNTLFENLIPSDQVDSFMTTRHSKLSSVVKPILKNKHYIVRTRQTHSDNVAVIDNISTIQGGRGKNERMHYLGNNKVRLDDDENKIIDKINLAIAKVYSSHTAKRTKTSKRPRHIILDPFSNICILKKRGKNKTLRSEKSRKKK